MNIFPKKLHKGSNIRVIAPSSSMAIILEKIGKFLMNGLASLGFNISFGKYVEECDYFSSSSIASRVSDFYDAFSDNSIDAVFWL